jgi:hypothetical protein
MKKSKSKVALGNPFKPRRRISQLTQENRQRIADLIREGASFLVAVRSVGISEDTANGWIQLAEGRGAETRKRAPSPAYVQSCIDFAYAVRMAEADAIKAAEVAVFKAGTGYNKTVTKTVTKVDETGVSTIESKTVSREFDWRAAERYLRVKSKEWRETGEQKVEVTVDAGQEAAQLMRDVNTFRGSNPDEEIDNI